ncbi:hypothetical protein GCM10027030_17690 [Luteococcus sediminum]
MSQQHRRRVPGPASNAVETAEQEMELAADDGIEVERARTITDFASHIGDLALRAGASAARTETLVRRAAGAFGLPVQLDVTYSRILISYEPTAATTPITMMRAVTPDQTDYDRLERVENLVSDVEKDDGLDLETAKARLNHITASPFEYPRWFRLAAAALLGAAIVVLLGGGPVDMVVTAVSTMLVDEVRRWLDRWTMGSFFTTAVCASIPTTLALLALVLQQWAPFTMPTLNLSLVIAAGMVSLLAGMGTVAAAGDVIDGNFLGAAARILEVVSTTGGIVMGLVATLWLGRSFGVAAQLEPGASQTPDHVLQLASAGLIALAFGVRCVMRARALATATVLGIVLWASYLGAAWITSSHPARVGIAALVLGFVTRLLVHWVHIPLVALTTTSIASLMPGMMLYRGVFAITDEDPTTATWLLLGSTYVAVGLAAGTSFGAMLAAIVLRRRSEDLHRGRLDLAEQAHG